jgi:hypothetical protein
VPLNPRASERSERRFVQRSGSPKLGSHLGLRRASWVPSAPRWASWVPSCAWVLMVPWSTSPRSGQLRSGAGAPERPRAVRAAGPQGSPAPSVVAATSKKAPAALQRSPRWHPTQHPTGAPIGRGLKRVERYLDFNRRSIRSRHALRKAVDRQKCGSLRFPVAS